MPAQQIWWFHKNIYGTYHTQPTALVTRNTGIVQQIALAVSGNTKGEVSLYS
jgi:hypothetical protein